MIHKSMIRHKIIAVASIFVAIMLFMGSVAGAAEAEADNRPPIEIYLNGTRLISDVPPVIKDDRTFVPIRIIGEALGYVVDYSEDTVTMRHSGSGMSIAMTIGEPSVTVNEQVVDLPVPAFIESGRTLAPVRFISEALGSRVDWYEGYGPTPDTVYIYSPYPVKTPGGVVQIASRVEEQFWELEGGWLGTADIGYSICAPIFAIPGSENLAAILNERIADIVDQSIDEMMTVYNEMIEENNPDEVYSCTDEFYYEIIEDNGRVLSLQIEGYIYLGGAHGMPYIYSYNIDYDQGILLTLADIFKTGANYKDILLQRMNDICEIFPDEYEYVTKPDYLDEESFHFKDGDLVLFYHPYELSSYARGFVEFRIPLESLAEYIKDEYLSY